MARDVGAQLHHVNLKGDSNGTLLALDGFGDEHISIPR